MPALSRLPVDLHAGYRAFVAGRLPDEQARFAELAEAGQSPKTMLIGCCDSRVPPEVIFNARPGELFVLRNIANLVPPYAADGGSEAAASLEFAVQALKVEHIVILGHARCGGVAAVANRKRKPLSPGDFVGSWMLLLDAVADTAPESARIDDEAYRAWLEVRSLAQSLQNLRGYPCVRILEERDRLTLHAVYFDIRTGLLAEYDETSASLRPLGLGPGRGGFICDAA